MNMSISGSILTVSLQSFGGWVRKHISFSQDLEENLETLISKSSDLHNLYREVERKVEAAVEKHLEPKEEVDGWLGIVEVVKLEVEELIGKCNQEKDKKFLGRLCYRNCVSSYKLGKLVMKKLNLIDELTRKGRFDEVAFRPPDSPVREMPVEHAMGFESMFDKVWGAVQDESANIIGLYGMGGIGKTTLLKRVNNKFLQICHEYHLLIWIEMTKQGTLENIQKTLWDKLMVPEAEWDSSNEQDRAVKLLRVMKKKRFLLFLDDIWQRIDLSRIGVPPPSGECKILFTTRSEKVCELMVADIKIKMECLPPDKAFELFQEKVGERTLRAHPDIPKLAKVVTEECRGLPLALVTIGRAMASRRTPQEWKHAIEVLKNQPSDFESIEDEVFSLLAFSYHSLGDDTLKNCFLYCSIFPENFHIDKGQLIDLWIGEGFLDKYDDVHKARDYGEHIIGTLRLACLVEASFEHDEDAEFCKSGTYIKMHDVLRDMALWIIHDHGVRNDKVIVQEDPVPIKLKRVQKWKEAERMSLWSLTWNRKIEKILGKLCFSNLRTLIMRNSWTTESFPNEFFKSTPSLRVLDLSNNPDLYELPGDIGGLIHLEYLNLMSTNITALPQELKKLVNLRFLLLSSECVCVPKEVLSSLSSLRVFRRFYGFRSGSIVSRYLRYESAMVEGLQGLEDLDEVSVVLYHAHSAQDLLQSPKLQSCLRHLSLRCQGLTKIALLLRRMDHLESLDICCPSLSEIEMGLDEVVPCISILHSQNHFHNLRRVSIGNSAALQDITLLVYCILGLQFLRIWGCYSMIQILKSDVGGNGLSQVFSCLTVLRLEHLPELCSICTTPLPFPLLKVISVINCPQLKSLPLDTSSAQHSLQRIRGGRKWWDRLQWDREATKQVFAPKFVDDDPFISYNFPRTGPVVRPNIAGSTNGYNSAGQLQRGRSFPKLGNSVDASV